MNTPLIELTKTFRSEGEQIRAVDGVDLDIRPGEVVALLGPNGAGKTTTIDMILGLTAPSGGELRVMGRAPRQAVLDGKISAVLQTGGLLADLKVKETVRLIASTFTDHAPIGDVMERAGITHLADRRVSKCSGGEQQRLRFALALLPEPELLILDEPTAGMDVTTRREFWAAMHEEASRGKTVIFATHYLEEASEFADRIVMMARGRIVADGPTEQIRATAAGRIVTADLPTDTAAVCLARLRALPAVSSVEEMTAGADTVRTRVRIRSTDSDAVAALLLTELEASNLEITAGSLDDAFVALTGDAGEQKREGDSAHTAKSFAVDSNSAEGATR